VSDFDSIMKNFDIDGRLLDVTAVPTGHINDTYIVTTGGKPRTRYVLQRINRAVFEDPPRMMANIARVTEHIQAKAAQTRPEMASRQVTLVKTRAGGSCYEDPRGCFWRAYTCIENAVTYDRPPSTEVAYEVARTFGWFQRALIDLSGPPLYETIPGFHDTAARLTAFEELLRKDPCNRAASARREIEFVLEHEAICHVVPSLTKEGSISPRIAHNDTKINNVMLDRDTGKGICVIDLDTVMPGLSIYDFGDLVRTAACPAAEDEHDLSKVAVDLVMCEALARGFAYEARHFLTDAERQHLVFAGKLITYEQCVRFLTDYLAGDVYYKVHDDRHNLDRSRTQRKLVQSIAAQEGAMNRIVEQVFHDRHG
jgi:Ser/Thr protein kinase RdoA (MazF antagonist)